MVNTGRRIAEMFLEQYRLHGMGITAAIAWGQLIGDAEEDRRMSELALMMTADRFQHPNS